MNGADVGMVQGGGRARFPPEALQHQRGIGDIGRQELESDKAAQHGIFRLVNHSHPAPAEFLKHPVVRDGPANHDVRAPLSLPS
jgi:hypothetical protein